MTSSSFQFFRLRKDNAIQGFMRYLKPSKVFYSKDKLWWEAKQIDYSEKDSYMEVNDCNRQWIFERDIIEMKDTQYLSVRYKAVVLFDLDLNEFTAVKLDDYQKIPKTDWHKYRLKVISFLFINPDIESNLTKKGLFI